jgi:hypothetical protein
MCARSQFSASLLALVLTCGSLSAQSIVAVTGSAGSPVISIDPASGALETLAFAGAPEPRYGGSGALDGVRRRLFFVRGGVVRPRELTSFDLEHHAAQVIGYPNAGTLSELVWDGASSRLLSVVGWPISVIAIEPSTGRSVTLSTLDPAHGGISVGIYAFDPKGRRLFFEIGNGDPELLAVVDLTTGQNYITRLEGSGHWFLRYDPRTDRLLTYGNACRPEIRSINPVTGEEKILGIVPPGLDGAVSQISAFDAEHGRLFYVTNTGDTQRLVTFDLDLGTFDAVPFPVRGVISAFEFMRERPRIRPDRLPPSP